MQEEKKHTEGMQIHGDKSNKPSKPNKIYKKMG